MTTFSVKTDRWAQKTLTLHVIAEGTRQGFLGQHDPIADEDE